MRRICISGLSGETLELELQGTDTIADVKEAVANAWSIPKSCQKILNESEVLDEEVVIERCANGSVHAHHSGVSDLALTMIVDLEAVKNNMNSQDTCSDVRAAKRVFALQELGILGLKGRKIGIDLVVNCLEEKDEHVSKAAADALTRFAQKGNQDILAALIPKLKHKRSRVKAMALDFLGRLAEVGDENVIAEICSCLEQHVISQEVTGAAIDALASLAMQGDQDRIVTALTNLLCHKSKLVKKAAVQALTRFSQQGIKISITTLKGCLSDSQSEVRVATLKAIAKIARKGDQEALSAVIVCSADTESSVRLAALCAMAEIAEKGDENAFSYSRLLGAYRRKGFGGTSTSSDEGRPMTPNLDARCLTPSLERLKEGVPLDNQSSFSENSSPPSQSAASTSTHGLGGDHGDCSGSFCQKREGREDEHEDNQRWDDKLKCNMQ